MEEVTTIEEVTSYVEETSEVTEQPVTTVAVSELCVDSMLSQIEVNTRQSAECLTSLLALFVVVVFFLLARWVGSVFKSILS